MVNHHRSITAGSKITATVSVCSLLALPPAQPLHELVVTVDRSRAFLLSQVVFVCVLVIAVELLCFVIVCFFISSSSLRKHAYSNVLKISTPKTESFQIKILIFFIILLKI